MQRCNMEIKPEDLELQQDKFTEAYDFDQRAEEIAAERGQVVVFPKDNQLFIDIDTDEDYAFFKRALAILGAHLGPVMMNEWPSKDGLPHRHISLTMCTGRTFTEVERLMIQGALGDDKMRTLLNVRRHLYGVEKASRLFETPEKAIELT